ncbi:MAG: glycoside hydrolase family 2 TIM barrel-domain containing protein [Planctomycetota bacterium]
MSRAAFPWLSVPRGLLAVAGAALLLPMTLRADEAANQPPVEGDPANAAPAADEVVTRERAAGAADGAQLNAEILPVVRLTPRDVRLPGFGPRDVLSLDGTWQYARVVPEGFDGTAASITDNGGEWTDITVPGYVAYQGFERMEKNTPDAVAWTRTFELPENFADKIVRLRFESVDGLTKLFVNGQYVAENEIAVLPSEFDITPFLQEGENEITLQINWSLATHWAKRELGGMSRSVYLQALPPVNLARAHVTTEVDGEHVTAVAHVRVANDSDQPVDDVNLRFNIFDQGQRKVATDLNEVSLPLPPIPAGQVLEMQVPIPVVDAVDPWTAETPNLYRMDTQLHRGDELTMTARQQFGFREIEVVGNELLINGTPIKWRGTNYHIQMPGIGENMTRQQIETDIRMFHESNMNVLRSRPTPSYEYVQVCDELGMYTTVEAMLTLMMYDRGPRQKHGNTPEIGPGVRLHIATMIESYKSNPSVILWGLGNENPYYDYFRTAAVGAAMRDPSRPLFFGSDARLGVDIDFMDVNDDHYPRVGKVNLPGPRNAFLDIHGNEWDYPTDRPNIFTEWAHKHMNNRKEYAFDPGIDDYWGYYAQAHADWTYAPDNQHILGGFLFKGAPYRNLGTGDDPIWRGIFDEDRRKNDYFWHVQKSHSPVRIGDVQGKVADGKSVFVVDNRYDYTNLNELKIEWSADGERGILDPDVPARTIGKLEIPTTAAPIELTITGTNDVVVDRYVLNAEAPAVSPLPTAAIAEVRETDAAVFITAGNAEYVISKETGLLDEGTVNGEPVLRGTPELVVRPTQLKNFRGQQKLTLVNQAANWQAEAENVDVQKLDDGGVRVITTGKYDTAEGTIATSINAAGVATISYDFNWTGTQEFNTFDWGFALRAAPEADTLKWKRDAQWSWYPEDHMGRPVGTAIAGGDASLANLRGIYTGGLKPWPFSQDMLDGVTNDFRATKFFIREGGLYNGDAGVVVHGDLTPGERQHLKAHPVGGDLSDHAEGEEPTRNFIFVEEKHGDRGDGYWLEVIEYHMGGTEPHLTKSIRISDYLTTKPGTKFTGEFTFHLTGGETGDKVTIAE